MGDESRVKMGKRDAWYKPPNCPLREHWLKDYGLEEKNENVLKCLFCKTSFLYRLQNVKAHKSGKRHKEHAAAWQHAQKDKASWQQRMDKGAEYLAQRRAGQAADPNLHTLFASTKQALAAGVSVRWRSKARSSALRPFPTQQPLNKIA
eukprot:scaffold67415_cov17-Tisochrysis_lutea.AAC.1